MKQPLIKKIRMVPMILVMGIIFLLSHQPGDSLYMPPFIPGFDKVAHMIVYAVLAVAILYAFQPELRNRRNVVIFSATVGICILYGIGDEFHQSFIPGRFASVADLAADTLGALGACTVWFLLKRKRKKISAAQFSEIRR